MKKSLFGALVLVSALAVMSGCSDKNATTQRKPVEVATMAVTPVTAIRWVDTFGQTEGAEEVEVRAQVGGVLRALNFKEGETVKAGQTLFEIEKDPYEASLRQAKAQTRQAQAELVKAQRDYRRASELIKVNAVSRQEYDDAKTSLSVAQSALALAQAQEKNAAIDLEHAMVPAPVSGIAGKSEVNVGSLVTAGTTLLTTITQPQSLRVTFAISDSELSNAKLTKDNLVRVFYPNSKEFIPARLDYIAGQVDADRGTLRLRAILPETDRLWPGQYVSVRIMMGEHKNAFLVPQGIVKQKADGTYAVYVYDNGVARERSVLLGNWEGKDWVVTSGLKAGDEVIINQIMRLRDGIQVTKAEPQKVETASATNAQTEAPAK